VLPLNRFKLQYLGAAAIAGLVFGSVPARSHQVEVQNDIGATIHIEPNDTPRAGRSALTWFALTRRGGRTIPLAQCSCTLKVYAQPRRSDAAPVLTPSLQAVSAERYEGIPGAEFAFPEPGAYELELSGRPQAGAEFAPFVLTFDVTVSR